MDSTFGVPITAAALDQFVTCFEGLKDPRTGNAGLHDLHELLFIAQCTVLSGDQGTLHDDVVTYFNDPASKTITAKPAVEGDHGRIETRTATVSVDIKWLQDDHQWPSLVAMGKVERTRETTGKTTNETAYYLFSAPLSRERANEVVLLHWAVENRLHWRLDVTMNGDQDRTRLDNGPHNLAVLRHMALNVMQKDKSKNSLRGKVMRAGWDDRYMVQLLALF